MPGPAYIYQAAGSWPIQTPSYVKRQPDEQLFLALQ